MVETGAGRRFRDLEAFLQAGTWDASRRILEDQPDLTHGAVVAELDRLINDPGAGARLYPGMSGGDAVELLHRHRQLLVRSREVGSLQAFTELVGSQHRQLTATKITPSRIPATGHTDSRFAHAELRAAPSPAAESVVSQPPASSEPQPFVPPTGPAPQPFVPRPKRSGPALRLLGALAGIACAVGGTWLGKIAALQINDNWLSAQLAAGSGNGPGGNRWVLVGVVLILTSGVAGAFGVQGLRAGLRAVPGLRRSKLATTGLAVTAALLLVGVGLGVLPPRLALGTLGGVRFPDGPASGTVVLREDFEGGQPPWSTRLGTAVGVAMESGTYNLRVKSEKAGTRNWGVGVTRPTSQLRSLPADVRVDATGLPLSASPGMYGVVCRHQSDTRFYFAVLGSDGEFRIGKVFDGKEVTFASGPLPEAIDPSARPRLQLACTGGQNGTPVQLVFWADTQRLAQATDRGTLYFSGPTLPTGSVGVAAASSLDFITITFDDVALVEL